MRFQRLLILVLAASAAAPGAFGQTAAAPVGLEAVLRAASTNIDVTIAGRALEAARGDVAAADHAPLPTLSLKAGSIDLSNGIGGGNLLWGKRIDKSVGVDWTLERGGKRAARVQLSQAAEAAARADLQETRVQQKMAAAAGFYELLAAQERAAHAQALQRAADELAAVAARRLTAGDISRQEAARTEIEAERARADARAAVAERDRAALALSLLTGLALPLAAQPGWPAIAPLDAGERSLESRADVRGAAARVEVARAALASAEALRRNDVTVGASYDHFPGTSTRLFEVRASVPLAGLLGGYDYRGEIARANAQQDQARDLLDKVKRVAAAEDARLARDVGAAAERARSYETTIVPRAREVAAMAELAYARGASGLTELIDARRTLRSVLIEETAARADHAKALAAWQLRHSESQE